MAEIVDILRERLTARRAEQFRLLGELVKVDSSNPPGDGTDSADLLEETLSSLGFEVERLTPPAELCEDMGVVAAPSVIARYRAGDGPTLVLCAGVDTRPAPGAPTPGIAPGTVTDGVLHGMGSRNSKSAACSFIYGALGAIETVALAGTVEIVLTHDTQSGGYLGSKWLLDEERIAPDMAIVAGHGEAVLTHHAGMIHFAIDLSIDPKKAEPGTDALNTAHAVMAALYAADADLSKTKSPVEGVGSPGLIVGAIEAGSRADQPPMEAVLWVGRRFLPSDDVTSVRRSMSVLVGKAMTGRRGIQCKVRPVLTDTALAATPATRPVVSAVLKAAQDGLGRRLPGARHRSADRSAVLCRGRRPGDRVWVRARNGKARQRGA